MDIKANRMEILRQVENGELTLEEATRWLAALDKVSGNAALPANAQPGPVLAQAAVPAESAVLPEAPVQPKAAPVAVAGPVAAQTPAREAVVPEIVTEQPVSGQAAPAQRVPFWRGWWLMVFVPGLLLVLAAVNWMYAGFLAGGLGWGFWLSFIPFSLGVVLLWLGWEIHMARWFYLRVRQRPGARPREIILNFPLPIGMINWAVRRFGRFSPALRGADVSDLLHELNQSVTGDGSVHIFVDDPNGGQVEIWIDGPRGG